MSGCPCSALSSLPCCPLPTAGTLPLGIFGLSSPSSRTSQKHKTKHKRRWQVGSGWRGVPNNGTLITANLR